MKPSVSNGRAAGVQRASHSGFLMIEVLITLLLMTAVAAMLPMMLRGVYQQRQEERFVRHAQIELANVATRLRAADTVSLESDDDKPQLSPWFLAQHPEATLSVSLQQNQKAAEEIVAVQLEISRPNGDQRPSLVQRLTTWWILTDDFVTVEEPAE